MILTSITSQLTDKKKIHCYAINKKTFTGFLMLNQTFDFKEVV